MMHMYAFIHICSNDNLKGCQCERKQRENGRNCRIKRWEGLEMVDMGVFGERKGKEKMM